MGSIYSVGHRCIVGLNGFLGTGKKEIIRSLGLMIIIGLSDRASGIGTYSLKSSCVLIVRASPGQGREEERRNVMPIYLYVYRVAILGEIRKKVND